MSSKSLYTKVSKKKIKSSFPSKLEGNNGDMQIISIKSRGTYLCLKDKGDWKISDVFKPKYKFNKNIFNDIKTTKIYGKSNLAISLSTKSETILESTIKTPLVEIGDGTTEGVIQSKGNKRFILKNGASDSPTVVLGGKGNTKDIYNIVSGTGNINMRLGTGRIDIVGESNQLRIANATDQADDYAEFVVADTGDLTISTIGDGTTDSDLTLDIDGSLVLDSANGKFIAKKAGTEFSATDSSYAGMILGYTAIGIDAADESYDVTNGFATIDSGAKVTFVAPPSGNVEIFVSVFNDCGNGSRPLHLGLSDNATYNTVDVTHEHEVKTGDETDEYQVNHYWTITGLTSGTSYTYWIGAKSSHNSIHVLRWGGNATAEYAPFIVKATALPSTIYDGS